MDERKSTVGAIAIGGFEILWETVNVFTVVKDFVAELQRRGGAPGMIADLLVHPAFRVSLALIAVVLGIIAFRSRRQREAPTTVPQTKRIGMDLEDSAVIGTKVSIENQDIAVRGKRSGMDLDDFSVK